MNTETDSLEHQPDGELPKQDEQPKLSTRQFFVAFLLTFPLMTILGLIGVFGGNAIAEAFDWEQRGDVILASLGGWLGMLASIWIAAKITSGAVRHCISTFAKVVIPLFTFMTVISIEDALIKDP